MLDDVYTSWLARSEAGHHDQNLGILGRLVAAHPDDPELHLLLALTLLDMERHADSLAAVYRAIDLGGNDAAILARAATVCLGNGDADTARECVRCAMAVEPPGFRLKKELRETSRDLRRREKSSARRDRLSASFDAEPRDARTASDLARELIKSGQRYAAYYVVARGLHHNPVDRRLRRLERKLKEAVPADERAAARRWAESGEPRTVSYSAPVRGRPFAERRISEAGRRQAEQ